MHGWKLSTIFKLYGVLLLANNKITRNVLYLLDGNILAVFFETTSH